MSKDVVKVEVTSDVSLVALKGSIVIITEQQKALLGDKVKAVKETTKKVKE